MATSRRGTPAGASLSSRRRSASATQLQPRHRRSRGESPEVPAAADAAPVPPSWGGKKQPFAQSGGGWSSSKSGGKLDDEASEGVGPPFIPFPSCRSVSIRPPESSMIGGLWRSGGTPALAATTGSFRSRKGDQPIRRFTDHAGHQSKAEVLGTEAHPIVGGGFRVTRQRLRELEQFGDMSDTKATGLPSSAIYGAPTAARAPPLPSFLGCNFMYLPDPTEGRTGPLHKPRLTTAYREMRHSSLPLPPDVSN